MPETYAKGTIRITFGAENTKAEAAEIADALKGILKG
jgi:cysteine sulfinate desulfinase/cysteine desulfurase-like protein